jgi:hypothetical protein
MKFSVTIHNRNKFFKDSQATIASTPSPTGAGDDETMTMKVPELKRGSLEATIYWCKQFQDLIRVSVKATFHSTLCTLPTHLVDKYFLQSLRFHLSM